ncbi:MAG: hypothetical protein R8G66_08785 [Cytophagales bacterium]|nr:hypothetical protein [Cytophagales bacterium]
MSSSAQNWASSDQQEFIDGCMDEPEEIAEEAECSPSDEDDFTSLDIEEAPRTKWTLEERENFIRECVAKAEKGLGTNKSRQYCHCMLFEVENKYPTASSADQMTHDDARPLAVECMGSPEWPEETQSQFLENCI